MSLSSAMPGMAAARPAGLRVECWRIGATPGLNYLYCLWSFLSVISRVSAHEYAAFGGAHFIPLYSHPELRLTGEGKGDPLERLIK